jgi:peptide/nickel transport system substrate-binding protein
LLVESILPPVFDGRHRVVLVTTSVVLAIACSRAPAPADTLRLAVPSPPEALDPRFATTAVAMRLSALVAPPLVVIAEDLRPQPLLAARVEQDSDRSWLVTLRAGLRFHDGAPVTAQDVAWTFHSMKDPATGSPHRGKLAHLLRVVVIDALTVRFELDAPWAPFLVDANAYGILSRRSCAVATDACRHAPIGAGPFFVERPLDDNETLALLAHDGSPYPTPAIARIEVKVARDSTTRLLELLDERNDLVAGDLAPADLAALERHHALAVESAPGLGFTYLAFNVRGPRSGASTEEARTARALANARVRRALAMALDVDTIIARKLRGRARRASGILPEGHWAKPDPALEPLIAFYPAGARALLDEAGFEVRDRGGRFRLVLATTTDRARQSVAIILAQAWRDVGVDVEIKVHDWAALYEDIQAGSFHAFSAKWVPVLEPDLMSWVFSSTNVPAIGKAGGNRGGFVDHELDGWLSQAQASTDPAERRALYARASARVAQALPVVPLWFEDEVIVRHRRLAGFRLARTGALLPLAAASLQ